VATQHTVKISELDRSVPYTKVLDHLNSIPSDWATRFTSGARVSAIRGRSTMFSHYANQIPHGIDGRDAVKSTLFAPDNGEAVA